MLVLRSFLSLKLQLLYDHLFATHFQILPFTEKKEQSENISKWRKNEGDKSTSQATFCPSSVLLMIGQHD